MRFCSPTIRICGLTRTPCVWALLLLAAAAQGFCPAAYAWPPAEEHVWVIESPTRGSTVTESPVLISALLLNSDGPAPLLPETEVVLNGEPIAQNIIVDGGRVLVLLDTPLPAGSHTISIRPVSARGDVLPILSWSFQTALPADPSREALTAASTRNGLGSETDLVPNLDGTIRVSLRTAALDGPGLAARQEPVRTGQLDASVTATAGKWSIPVSAYWTSDASDLAFRRNRLSVGAERTFGEGPDVSLRVGDEAARFGDFTAAGVQTRGTYASIALGSLTVRGVYGQTRRALPSRSLSLPGSVALSPLEPVYDRRIGVVEVQHTTRYVDWGVRGLRGRDLISSLSAMPTPLSPSARPGDNTVVEPSLSVDVPRLPLRINGAVAWSLTTTDLRLGASPLDTIEAQLDQSLAPSVRGLAGLMTVNASTAPLANPGSAVAWRAAGTVELGAHRIRLSHRAVGPAFQSFGTAFLQTGRQQTRLGGQSRFFNGRLFATLSGRRETSFGRPTGNTFESYAASGSVRALALQRTAGRLTLSTRAFADTRTFDTASALVDVRQIGVSPTVATRWTTGAWSHRVRLSGSQMAQSRDGAEGSTQRVFRVSAGESFRSVDVEGGWSRLSGSFDSGHVLQDARQWHGQISVSQSPITVRLHASRWTSDATRFQPRSRRTDLSLRLGWTHALGTVRVRFGYRDLSATPSVFDYTEAYSLIEPSIRL